MSKLEVKIVSAAWCAPCKALKPVLQGLCEDNSLSYTEYDLDSKEGGEFASQHGVRGVPTVFVVEDGKIINTLVGSKTKKELEKALQL